MKVTVRVHESPQVAAQFQTWRRSLPGSRDDQIRWGKFYLECLGKAVLNGFAPAPILKGDDGDLIRWEFLKGVEFTFVRRVISRHESEVVIMGVQLLPPPQTG